MGCTCLVGDTFFVFVVLFLALDIYLYIFPYSMFSYIKKLIVTSPLTYSDRK